MRHLLLTLTALTVLAALASAREPRRIPRHVGAVNLPALCAQMKLPEDGCHKELLKRADPQPTVEEPKAEEPKPEEQKK